VSEGLVSLTQAEYDSLKRDSDFLQALESAGVDNWEGYSYAWQILEGEDPFE
jgi:hypothetical protein